jgi:hypothetical protein
MGVMTLSAALESLVLPRSVSHSCTRVPVKWISRMVHMLHDAERYSQYKLVFIRWEFYPWVRDAFTSLGAGSLMQSLK